MNTFKLCVMFVTVCFSIVIFIIGRSLMGRPNVGIHCLAVELCPGQDAGDHVAEFTGRSEPELQ